MNKFIASAIGCGIALGLALGLLQVQAQPVTQNSISGNECWSAAQGPGGSSNWLCINTVRNGRTLVLKSGSGAATSTAVGGILYWVGTAPTTWAVTMPSPAFDGESVSLDTDTTLTTMVTVTAGTGQTLHATYNSQTLTALTPVTFHYNAATAAWFRMN
jgi:hypothetical protein